MLEPDLLIDRRRLKRRLNFWRAIAVLAVVAALTAVARPSGRLNFATGLTTHIARLNITISSGHISKGDSFFGNGYTRPAI